MAPPKKTNRPFGRMRKRNKVWVTKIIHIKQTELISAIEPRVQEKEQAKDQQS